MTDQKNAVRHVLTYDEIRAVWVEHGLDDEAVEDFARAIESALLSKLRAPVADERECGNADCGWRGTTERMCGSIGPLCPECGETTEASAPVAGEAQPVAYQVRHPYQPEWKECDLSAYDVVRQTRPADARPLYAAPQASEAVRDALQKLVDMYVLNQGSDHEHITCYTPPPASHLTPKQRAKSETWKAWDDARAALSAQPGAQKKENGS